MVVCVGCHRSRAHMSEGIAEIPAFKGRTSSGGSASLGVATAGAGSSPGSDGARPSTPPKSAVIPVPSVAPMFGMLSKRGHKLVTWRERYFELVSAVGGCATRSL